MKRAIILMMVVVVATALVIACGGGGGGSKGLATGGFTKTVADVTDNTWGAPFYTMASYEQHLYRAADINGSGYIESISLRYAGDEPATACPDVSIMMGNSSAIILTTTFADNIEQGRGALETVLSSGPLTIPSGSAGDYFTISLDTPFLYNGVDNLIVYFEVPVACDNNLLLAADTATYSDIALWNGTGAATGSLYDHHLNAKFTFEGGDNTQDYGGVNNNFWPFSSELPRTQNLYLASDIDGSGPITGLAFQLNQVSTEQTYTYSVTMGHTTLSALAATYADNYDAGSPVTLASAATFTVPAGIPAGEWFWVPLPDRTFKYNGSDNLIVEVEVTAGTGDIDLRETDIPGTRAWGYAGNDVADNVDSTAYHVKLRFNGGPMQVITNGGVTGYFPPFGFPGDDFIMQTLYDNTALGTSGRITEFSFRLGADSTAFDHPDLNLVLGNTTLASLAGTSLAGNIESGRTAAFSGTLSIPAGLKAGDWVTVPLTTPFNYDATKNLVVQWDGPPNLSGIVSIGHTENSGRYTGHVQANLSDRTSDTGNSYDLIYDISLTLD